MVWDWPSPPMAPQAMTRPSSSRAGAAVLVDLSESGKDPFTSRQQAHTEDQAYSDHMRSRLAWVLKARSAASPSGWSLASVSRIR